MQYRVISPVADVYGAPDTQAMRGKLETQLVLGEIFVVEEEKNGWCKGYCGHDKYPGHVETHHLKTGLPAPTHIVTAARSHIYRDETIKSPVAATLSFGSQIHILEEHDAFARIGENQWIYKKHISAIDVPDKDHAATARKFLEVPYYWGGRSGFGLDCSGLVQICLARAGVKTERDTEQQIETIGAPTDKPQAGDIVFFKGHVGIMMDNQNLIHANAFHMKVTIEPLQIVAGRSGDITAVRRVK